MPALPDACFESGVDASGSHAALSLVDGQWCPGRISKGTNGILTGPASVPTSGKFSCGVWLYLTAENIADAGGVQIEFADVGGASGVFIRAGILAGNLRISITRGSEGFRTVSTSPGWHYVSASITASGRATVYYDGVQLGTPFNVGVGNYNAGNDLTLISCDLSGYGEAADQLMSKAEIYSPSEHAYFAKGVPFSAMEAGCH